MLFFSREGISIPLRYNLEPCLARRLFHTAFSLDVTLTNCPQRVRELDCPVDDITIHGAIFVESRGVGESG